MIPKIIHYCWLSGDPIPAPLQKYMKSWKTYLPEYEFWLWNFDRFDINSSVWVQEAFQAKKYAFAADYIRCYALYNYGGIYLDMDVEVLKPFDDLLVLPYFIGQEQMGIEAAVMGVEKNHLLFRKMLDYYQNRHFVKLDGCYDMLPLPQIMRRIIDKDFKYMEINHRMNFNKAFTQNIYIFPKDWFSPKYYTGKLSGKLKINRNTYTIHHFEGSWCSRNAKIKRKIKKIIGHRLTSFLVKIKSWILDTSVIQNG